MRYNCIIIIDLYLVLLFSRKLRFSLSYLPCFKQKYQSILITNKKYEYNLRTLFLCFFLVTERLIRKC